MLRVLLEQTTQLGVNEIVFPFNVVDCVARFRHVANGITGRGVPGIARCQQLI